MIQVGKVVNGIIFTHGFHKWGIPLEDLHQEAMLQNLRALDIFNPNYITKKGNQVKYFNYVSLVSKKALGWMTLRDRRARETLDVDEYLDGDMFSFTPQHHTMDDVVEETCKIMKSYYRATIDISYENYVGTPPRLSKYLRMTDLFQQYMKLTQTFLKRDFFRFVRETTATGMTSNIARSWLKRYKIVIASYCKEK